MNIETTDLKILICDDSITNVLILKKLMESEGYKDITSLTDPTKVLPAMLENKFDLLLLDIEMPKRPGLTSCSKSVNPLSANNLYRFWF